MCAKKNKKNFPLQQRMLIIQQPLQQRMLLKHVQFVNNVLIYIVLL